MASEDALCAGEISASVQLAAIPRADFQAEACLPGTARSRGMAELRSATSDPLWTYLTPAAERRSKTLPSTLLWSWETLNQGLQPRWSTSQNKSQGGQKFIVLLLAMEGT